MTLNGGCSVPVLTTDTRSASGIGAFPLSCYNSPLIHISGRRARIITEMGIGALFVRMSPFSLWRGVSGVFSWCAAV
ncbi:hypothetical protein DPMN_061183 [Dreissena polymorpha]|uniref:Uncharacterized protein n=1 Tax=Dreissena polymorpha TaxID=45954 RepID=A0A9D4C7B2_DREPO|nr:hypothetical protein DPMN_061183 [Dreissena polymorpha]